MTQPSKIVLATGNPGKVRELANLLSTLDIEVIPQTELDAPEAEETGLTFVENAIIKARNAATHTGLPAIADDSGLAVDALNGAPGVYSARYADDGDNNAKLLAALQDVPEQERSARFHCAMVYMAHERDPAPLIVQTTWEGSVLAAPQGSGGFGYDPLFLVPEHGCSAAELSADTKNRLSHRGQAIRQLVAALNQLTTHNPAQ